MGGSTGINVAGAIRMAKEMGPGHTIVTVLCDYGTRYASKLFNPDFLREKRLARAQWLEAKRQCSRASSKRFLAMTELLFRDDAYLKSATPRLCGVNERGGILLDRTVFYATAGGQPGDKGALPSMGRHSRSPPPSMTRQKTLCMFQPLPIALPTPRRTSRRSPRLGTSATAICAPIP